MSIDEVHATDDLALDASVSRADKFQKTAMPPF